MSNLGNPKMAIFFSSLLPQFVTPGTPTFLAMLGLGLVFVGLTIAWLSGYAIVLARFRRVLGRARVRRTIDAVSGALLGVIETGVPTANVAWGEDGSTLFIAADTSIYRLRTRTRGSGWTR